MKGKILLFLLPIALMQSLFLVNHSSTQVEIDRITAIYNVIDGDTFDAFLVGRVRLADVNANESGELGYNEAKEFLKRLVEDKRVYLDIDDLYVTDEYNRTVCLVYVRHNSTHLTNVNKALLDEGLVEVDDHTNEFDPNAWTLFINYTVQDSQKDKYQEILLNFYTQELAAHGTMLFAATTATFLFTTNLVNKTKKFISCVIFVFFGGFLLGLSTYIGFRLLYYGMLTNGAIRFPGSSTEYEYFDRYVNAVSTYTFEIHHQSRFPFEKVKANLFQKLGGGLNFDPWGAFPASFYIGSVLAYLIFYAFGYHSLNRKDASILFSISFLPVAAGSIPSLVLNFGSGQMWILALGYCIPISYIATIIIWKKMFS